MSGTLYVVGTPIGNLGDVTFRALEALGTADLIAAEDTRTTARLLERHGIRRPMAPLHEHSPERAVERIVGELRAGRTVAYVSEAGTPGVSDPGAALVKRAREAGLRVVPVPGPCALAAAWSVSGLDSEFRFVGFLPSSPKLRRRRLRALAAETVPLVFYEGPHRAARMLRDVAAILGDRPVFVARELTKIHEETLWTTAAALAGRYEAEKPKGEITLIVT